MTWRWVAAVETKKWVDLRYSEEGTIQKETGYQETPKIRRGQWDRPGKASPALSTPMFCLLSRYPTGERQEPHHCSSRRAIPDPTLQARASSRHTKRWEATFLLDE